MFGYDHEEYLKEQYLDDRPMFGCGASEDYENFCNEIDQMKDEECFNSDTSIKDINNRIAEKSLSFPADTKIGEDKMDIKKIREMKKAHRLDVRDLEVENEMQEEIDLEDDFYDSDYDYLDFSDDTYDNDCETCEDTSCQYNANYSMEDDDAGCASQDDDYTSNLEDEECEDAMSLLEDAIDTLAFVEFGDMSEEAKQVNRACLNTYILQLQELAEKLAHA